MAIARTSADPLAPTASATAQQRYLRACVRALETRGWQQRLAPLAQVLVDLRLVRGRNEHGAPLRRLDGELLQQTLCRLLGEGDENALLVYDVLVEGMDPQWVAEDRGVTVSVLPEQLREALRWVAGCYEARANGHLGEGGIQRVHDR
jgi:hypothetical protein